MSGRRHALPRRVLGLVVAVAALATSCGTGGGESATTGELLDFALVQDTPFVFEADPTDPGRGIFRVRTTEPMICAIVWGETDAFGNFNNSLAMNGTGIVDHDVFLPGAVPGETYVFRVQGTTADGKQYRSEVGTFTVPVGDETGAAATDSLDPGRNLALDAIVTDASSTFGAGWEPENALDGDTTTEWATAGDGDRASITIDLGAEQPIGAVEFLTRSMADGSAITETYTVRVDGGEPLGPYPAGNLADPRTEAVDTVGRTLTFDVERTSGGNVGAVEIGVYALGG